MRFRQYIVILLFWDAKTTRLLEGKPWQSTACTSSSLNDMLDWRSLLATIRFLKSHGTSDSKTVENEKLAKLSFFPFFSIFHRIRESFPFVTVHSFAVLEVVRAMTLRDIRISFQILESCSVIGKGNRFFSSESK